MKIIDWITANWAILIPLVYELIARLWPTKWDISILDWIFKLLNLIVPNKRIPSPNDKVVEPGKNQVVVPQDKFIL